VRRCHRPSLLIVVLTVIAACGDESSGGSTTTGGSTTAATATTATPTTATTPTTAAASTTALDTTTTAAATTTTEIPVAVQPAIWPAAGVVFTTPEGAATDFLANVFGDGPMLGSFQAGDQRSGEIEVFASVDGAPIGNARSLLLLRQLGPSDGWFVVAAVSNLATVETPTLMAIVPAAPLTVEGVGTGFEATIVVSAFVAGQADIEFDRQVTMAGNLGETLPYTVTLDLSAASPGDVVVLLVRGGTGLETDPGDFAAIPVRIE
jgi:hypothetical protein